MNEQISVTPWTGYPVPVPDLLRYPEATLDGEIIWLWDWEDELRGEMAAPPPELYLRHARQIDLDDRSALLEFVRKVGGVPYLFEDQDLWPDGIGGERVRAKEGRGLFAEERNRRYVSPQMVGGCGWGVHVDEVAYRLRILDILGRHAVAYRRGDYLAPIWQEAIVAEPGQPHYVNTEEDAWRWFTYHADQALRVFHPRVQVFAGTGSEVGVHTPTFLQVGVLQLVNDLASEVDYLTCPHCGQVFARQVGGSSHFSRSTGVTYCTPKCATNARVRAYRARKRAERERVLNG
jgi:uncharacterized C2H2 Zn-finger protein